MTILEFLVAVLGGGLVAAMGNWVHSARSARRQREIDHLQEQLRSIYGALYFFTNQNEKLFELCKDVNNAYSAHFQGMWSQNVATQDKLTEQMEATIDLGNAYVARVVENNKRVMELLEQNWHLVDPSDATVFSEFQVDYTRFLTEVMEDRRKRVPWGVTTALPNISYMRPAMIEAVRLAVQRKQARLQELRPVGLMRPGSIWKRLRASKDEHSEASQ